jgi:hypothetical protein
LLHMASMRACSSGSVVMFSSPQEIGNFLKWE